jgi:hypothetical protein
MISVAYAKIDGAAAFRVLAYSKQASDRRRNRTFQNPIPERNERMLDFSASLSRNLAVADTLDFESKFEICLLPHAKGSPRSGRAFLC